jgi:glycosyltransferase involved in cell wall biosynthesis
MIAPEPFFQPRGTPISVYHRLKALSKLGLEVDVLTYHLGEDVPIEGVRVFRIPRCPLIRQVKVGPSYIKPFLDLLLWIKALGMLSTGRYDLIHAHEEAAYFSLPLAGLFGVKLLYDMHSSLPQQLVNYRFSSRGPLIWLFARLERSVLRRAHSVITICPDLEQHVSRLGDGTRQFMIENFAVGEPLEEGDRQAAEVRKRLGIGGRPVVVYTGTFEKNQGLEMVIQGAPEVIADHPELIYLLVGGRSDQVERLRALAEDAGVADHFLFPGQRPMDEIPVYLRAADVLISPRSEGTNTPLKIYAYLASERPIVATDLETHRQVLDDQTALLTPPTADGLAGGIRRVLESASLRDGLRRAVHQRVLEHYSYHLYLKKTKEVFDYVGSL